MIVLLKHKSNTVTTRYKWSNHEQSIRLRILIDDLEEYSSVIFSAFMLILILVLFATATISVLFIITIMRISRITQLESQFAQSARQMNTSILKDYLQTIPISAIEIDAEVVALKDEIINAAHKHHLTIDRDETQPDNPFSSPENQKYLIAIVEKQKEVATTRVG